MQGEEAEDWDDWQDEEEPAQSLFSTMVLPSAAAAFDFDAQQSGFDLRAYRKQVLTSPEGQPAVARRALHAGLRRRTCQVAWLAGLARPGRSCICVSMSHCCAGPAG